MDPKPSYLSTELGTDGASGLVGLCGLCAAGTGIGGSSSGVGGRCGTGTSHLHGNNTTEWTSTGGVGNLNQADVLLTGDGTSAAHASWHLDCDGVVLVNVAGTLDDSHVDERAHHDGALLGCGDVTLGTWHLSSDLGLSTLREGTGSSGVDDGGVRASSVSGDDVDGSAEGSSIGDLRKGAAGLGHDGSHVSHGVGTSTGLSETIGGGVLAVEDGGVDLSDLVLSWAWNNATLDTKTSGVSSGITSL
jgi:hypothetical protein